MNAIERHTLELIGEDPDNPDVFTDGSDDFAGIRDSINDAIDEISGMTGAVSDTCYIPIRANRQFYKTVFSVGSCAWITDVWLWTQKRRLEQTDILRLNYFSPKWLKNTGNPYAYFPIGFDVIGIWPKPSSDADVLEVRANIIPEPYTTDTDIVKLREDFQWAAAYYAAGEYYAGRGDAKSAIWNHNQYLKRMGLDFSYPIASLKTRVIQTEKEPWPKDTG